jgi:hypothetical protein
MVKCKAAGFSSLGHPFAIILAKDLAINLGYCLIVAKESKHLMCPDPPGTDPRTKLTDGKRIDRAA